MFGTRSSNQKYGSVETKNGSHLGEKKIKIVLRLVPLTIRSSYSQKKRRMRILYQLLSELITALMQGIFIRLTWAYFLSFMVLVIIYYFSLALKINIIFLRI